MYQNFRIQFVMILFLCLAGPVRAISLKDQVKHDNETIANTLVRVRHVSVNWGIQSITVTHKPPKYQFNESIDNLNSYLIHGMELSGRYFFGKRYVMGGRALLGPESLGYTTAENKGLSEMEGKSVAYLLEPFFGVHWTTPDSLSANKSNRPRIYHPEDYRAKIVGIQPFFYNGSNRIIALHFIYEYDTADYNMGAQLSAKFGYLQNQGFGAGGELSLWVLPLRFNIGMALYEEGRVFKIGLGWIVD